MILNIANLYYSNIGVDQILAMDINGDDGDDVAFNTIDNAIPSPYLSYAGSGNANDSTNMDERSVRGGSSGANRYH